MRRDLTAAVADHLLVHQPHRPGKGHRPWCLSNGTTSRRFSQTMFASLALEVHAWTLEQGIRRYTLGMHWRRDGAFIVSGSRELRIRFRSQRDRALWIMTWCG